MIEELVKYLVTNLVEDKNKVQVTLNVESDRVTILQVKVAKSDMGRVIGKNGKVASALRTIVKSASNKEHIRYVVKIDELEEA